MRIKSRILALVMTAALVLTLFPAMAFAGDEVSQSGNDTTIDSEIQAKIDSITDEEPSGDTDSDPVSDEVVPVEVSFSGNLYGIIGTTGFADSYGEPTDENTLYTTNFGIYVQYSDGSEARYECLEYEATDDDGNKSTEKDYIRQIPVSDYEDVNADTTDPTSFVFPFIDEESLKPFKEGDNEIDLTVIVPYNKKNSETGESEFAWTALTTKAMVKCSYYEPTAIRFVPASGFVPNAYVGFNCVNEETFYGKGNSFVVEYKDRPIDPEYPNAGIEVTYKYVKKTTSDGVVEGFYSDGNINWERLDLSEGIDCVLKKGTNEVTLPYTEFIPTLNKSVTIDLKCKLKVTKYNAYGNWPIFSYTGKNLTKKQFAKKFVVRNSEGKKIPASDYTYTLKKSKKMGWYTVTIKFKDTNKYVKSIDAVYVIGPKIPKVTKVTAGKKKLTVKWKKFTKKELKNIDGAYIEVSTDKNFFSNYKRIKVTKKQLKKLNKKTIKKLKKGKKYYVQMYTYKKIKSGGEKVQLYSDTSNVKKKKTK